MLRVEKVSRLEEKKMKLFAECQIVTLGKHISLPSARQLHSANIFLCGVFFLVCRMSNFAECFLHRLPSAFILPSVFFAALGKGLVCRVPEGMHSANIKTLGKEPVSDGVICVLNIKERCCMVRLEVC